MRPQNKNYFQPNYDTWPPMPWESCTWWLYHWPRCVGFRRSKLTVIFNPILKGNYCGELLEMFHFSLFFNVENMPVNVLDEGGVGEPKQKGAVGFQ